MDEKKKLDGLNVVPERFGADDKVLPEISYVIRDQLTAPLCIACSHYGECLNDPGSSCSYELVDKDECVKRLFVRLSNDTDTEEEREELAKFQQMFIYLRGGNSFTLHEYSIRHRVCEDCGGTGVNIGVSIGTCDCCGGIGVVDKDIDPGFTTAFIVYCTKDRHILGMYHDRDDAVQKIPTLKKCFGFWDFNIAEILLSKKLENIDFDSDILVVFDSKSSRIVDSGTWEDVHGHMGIGTHLDIERYTAGALTVYPEAEFYNKYQIMETSFLDKLYSEAFANIIGTYAPQSSYNGAEVLVSAYCQLYPSIDDIRTNLYKHLSTDRNYVVPTYEIPVLDKIIEDFSLVGMNISKTEAANVIDRVKLLISEENGYIARLTKFNAVAVFLIEYVTISAEYNDMDVEIN